MTGTTLKLFWGKTNEAIVIRNKSSVTRHAGSRLPISLTSRMMVTDSYSVRLSTQTSDHSIQGQYDTTRQGSVTDNCDSGMDSGPTDSRSWCFESTH